MKETTKNNIVLYAISAAFVTTFLIVTLLICIGLDWLTDKTGWPVSPSVCIICFVYLVWRFGKVITESEEEDEKIRKELIEDILEDAILDGNEIKPKFKVDDWIVNNRSKDVFLIKNINSGYCSLEDTNGNIYSPCLPPESDFHLWTFADAKDGDVLYLQHDGKEHIIIYKGVIKERFRTFVSAYCAYNGIVDAFCFADVSRYADLAYGGIVPATKEQRDTLLKAMADAGYTFDFDKKELKKIAQKPEENKGNIGGISANPEWSGADKAHIESILERLEGMCKKGATFTATRFAVSQDIDWLKSLRPHNRWKPSDAQIKVCKEVYADLLSAKGFDLGTVNSELNRLEEELKKLKEE